jgi:hypothetical protein
MKKKETLWEMLKRLDEEAGQFNVHLSEANRYFDSAASRTKKVLQTHEQQLHDTIKKFRAALRSFIKENKNKPGQDA